MVLPRADTAVGKLAETLAGPLRTGVSFALTVTLALVAAVPILYLADSDPVTAYSALLEGSLGSDRAVSETLLAATPLFLGGLAVALAFQAGLFNLGVEGQLLMGGLVAGALGAKLDLPPGLHLVLVLVAAMAAGALWALLPAVLKAFRGVHEVITTIMLNFVAFSISRYLVSPDGLLVSKTQPAATDPVLESAQLPRIWAPTRLHAGALVAVAAGVAAWYLLFRTPLGYRLRVVGRNPVAARYMGISPPRTIVKAMLLSGAFAGLAGAVEVLGLHRRYFDAFSPGYGFDAIAVALLGFLNPIGVAVAALFFGMLRAGSVLLQAEAGISRDMISIISGLVVAFVAATVVVERISLRRRGDPPALPSPTAAAEATDTAP
jgi:ABC-type uncharacterized transport system permease subunit